MQDTTTNQDVIVSVELVGSQDKWIDAVTMSSSSSLDELLFETRPVMATTAGGEDKPLVVLVTDDGRRLAVTEQHAILVATGEMQKAVDLTTKDRLVDQTGQSVGILRIERVYTSRDVHNFLTYAGLDPYGHLVVAEGLVVGDVMWQNTLAKQLGEILLRR